MRTFAEKTKHCVHRSELNSVFQSEPTAGNHVQKSLLFGTEDSGTRLSSSNTPHFGFDFGHISLRPPSETVGVQTKLTISRPGDQFEQEADQIADQVMSMPNTDFSHSNISGGPRSKYDPVTMSLDSQRVQTKRVSASNLLEAAPPIAPEVSQSSGQALEPEVRLFMEQRFGHDFSAVQVHTDSRAARSAQFLGARAYTFGSHIVFAEGQYQPGNSIGRSLLAHELTHVLQQESGGSTNKHIQRQNDPQADTDRQERLRRAHLPLDAQIREDAFDLCVVASALGFIPTVTEEVVQQTYSAMQAVLVHQVSTLTEFMELVDEFSTVSLMSSQQGRERFIAHHRSNLRNLGISGQTLMESVLGEQRILIVGSPGLISKREFVERHERGHVGLHSLGVPVAQHHDIMSMFGPAGLGVEHIPHLGVRIRT